MAELEGDGRGSGCAQRGCGEEVAQERQVGLEVGRQLEEQQAELAGFGRRGDEAEEFGYVVVAVTQAGKWVMRCGALKEKRKPAGTWVSHSWILAGSGSLRKV